MEHPEFSHAWRIFNLPRPPLVGWSEPDEFGGRSCRVDQGQYGHPARKSTWLYAVLPLEQYPELDWSRSTNKKKLELSPTSKMQAKLIRQSSDYRPPETLTTAERIHTPLPFARLLVQMANLWNETSPEQRARMKTGGVDKVEAWI